MGLDPGCRSDALMNECLSHTWAALTCPHWDGASSGLYRSRDPRGTHFGLSDGEAAPPWET